MVKNHPVPIKDIDGNVLSKDAEKLATWKEHFERILFLKIVHQKGLFDAIKETLNYPTCRRILHIYRQWFLMYIFREMGERNHP